MFGLIGALIGWLSYHLGLRTDAASSTGSVSAKTRAIVEDTVVIGAAGDTRASNTVMGWLATPIKSIQRGTSTITGATGSLNVAISAVVTAKSFLTMSCTTTTNDVRQLARGKINTTTQLVFTRGISSGDTEIDWQVVEYY